MEDYAVTWSVLDSLDKLDEVLLELLVGLSCNSLDASRRSLGKLESEFGDCGQLGCPEKDLSNGEKGLSRTPFMKMSLLYSLDGVNS